MMKKLILCLMFLLLTPLGAFATQAQMNEALVKIIHQLQAIKPLLVEVKRAQPKNRRVKFHVEDWRDLTGTKHAGLKSDLALIQGALIKVLHREQIEPRHFSPIKGDFTGEHDV